MENRGAQLLSLTIEIGDGRQDIIKIHEFDEAEALAREFSEKHSLDQSLEGNLVTLISQNKYTVQSRQSARSPDSFRQSELSNSRLSSSVLKSRSMQRSNQRKNSSASLLKANKKEVKLNIGQKMYLKGMEMKENQQKSIQARQQAEEETLKQEVCTFRPAINEYSSLLSPRYFEKTEELLMRKSTAYKERLETLKASKQKEVMKECTFSPKIHAYTKSMAVPKHEELHSQAELRKKKRKMVSETNFKLNYNFNPNNVQKSMTLDEQEKFADYLIKSKQEMLERRERAIEEAKSKELSPNGRKLFKPSTGKGPSSPRLEGSQTVHDYLYSKRNQKKDKVAQHEGQHLQSAKETANSPKVSNNSAKIFDQFRGKQYAKLFTLMDSDEDGSISSDKISIDLLDNTTLEILAPLFNALDDGLVLDIGAFVNFMEQIWNKLTLKSRNHLLKREEKSVPKEQQQFKTGLSPKSYKMARNKTTLMSRNIYERFQHTQLLGELKMQKIKEITELAEMKDCTFRPVIKKYSRKK